MFWAGLFLGFIVGFASAVGIICYLLDWAKAKEYIDFKKTKHGEDAGV